MNFIESIPSLIMGRKIKRADGDIVYFSNDWGATLEGRSLSDGGDAPVFLDQDEILSDDWEVIQ